MIIQAPTASGKTILFDFALLRLFGLSKKATQLIAIYVAPLKALCQEKRLYFEELFAKTNGLVLVQELTGDSEVHFLRDYYRDEEEGRKQVLRPEGLLVMTPEKLNLLLRKWRDFGEIVERI